MLEFRPIWLIHCICILAFIPLDTFGQKEEAPDSLLFDLPVSINYGNRGWEFQTRDQKFRMEFQFRLQFRYTGLSDLEIDSVLWEGESPGGTFEVKRARMKVGGHAFNPHIQYYLEYDFPSSNLLDWRITFNRISAIQIRLGQWKINFNSERVISSGRQQLVERSISNRYFTLDRQVGMMIQGHIFRQSLADAWYYLGVFNGNGINSRNNDGSYLLLARYQWNYLGRDTKLSFSDMSPSTKPHGYIAFAATRNRSAYTAYSSNGGQQLPGFQEGSLNRYLTHQLLFEFMFKHNGFMIKNETHYKHIDDRDEDVISKLWGGYIIAGYFLYHAFPVIPEPLEIVARYALVDGDTVDGDPIREYTVGANWFFKEHLNKLSIDYSLIRSPDLVDADKDNRIRLQWDISF